jgi:hypothetical protein
MLKGRIELTGFAEICDTYLVPRFIKVLLILLPSVLSNVAVLETAGYWNFPAEKPLFGTKRPCFGQ